MGQADSLTATTNATLPLGAPVESAVVGRRHTTPRMTWPISKSMRRRLLSDFAPLLQSPHCMSRSPQEGWVGGWVWGVCGVCVCVCWYRKMKDRIG
jgi:hypothetical protein